MPLAMGMQGNIQQGNFLDTDVYSWMNRVMLLNEHGDWFDRSLPNVNPPAGHTQHWSRRFDAWLYAGAAAGAPWYGFRAALEHWAVWVSPFLQALTLIALLVILRPVLPSPKQSLPAIGLLFVGHNALLQSTSPLERSGAVSAIWPSPVPTCVCSQAGISEVCAAAGDADGAAGDGQDN